jgi:hypothetical protein
VRRGLAAASLLLPLTVFAQDVVIREPGPGPAAEIVRRVVAGPHVVRAGSTPLELPRDSTITASLLVLGRPTYLASRVQGDVVVIGADLYLRPGVDVSGRAVAIGGTVAETTLGRVSGGVESRRDETFLVRRDSGRYSLDYRADRVEESEAIFQLGGLFGLQMPKYDRVDGLSLGVGALVQLHAHAVEIEPTVTYRSRLGVVDPGVQLRLNPTGTLRFEGRAARDTRTNDNWIYGDLVNSALVFFAGADARNYFRTDVGEGRLVAKVEHPAYTLEPHLGARFERVWPITAVGNVYSVTGKTSVEKIQRPNPLVEPGHLASALLGAELSSSVGAVTAKLSTGVEQSFKAPPGTSNFLQLTVDGSVEFPTFATQRLYVRTHGVATHGDAVPMARFAYLGGSGTLRTLELLEQGGTALLYVESRYLIPIEAVQLPVIGPPVLTLRDAFGAAGIGALPGLQHEIGVGIGVSVLRVEYVRAVAGRSGHEFGVGISLSK